MQSSPDTLRVLLVGFASVAWSKVSKSTVLDRPVLAIGVKLLELSGYSTVITCTFAFHTKYIFRCLRGGVMAQFELAKHKFSN